jgi:valyl-tRNA synthetase
MSSELSKAYDPAGVEPRLYDWWERSGFFHAEPDDPGDPFCIVIPLPNVTGSLHIGHALDHSVQDALIRRARMQGRNAMWQPGTDHAGIATQMVVERQIAAEGTSRRELGREAFVERVWEWKQQSGGTILRQMRRLGASCDWRRAQFTLDDHYVAAVRKVFCDLHAEGLIYRGNRLVNWDPVLGTAMSDIEVDHVEVDGELAHLRYPGADHSEGIVVATTRAETMLGDTAVAVHPDDDRYRHLVGTVLRHPLLDRELPVIADDGVDPSFGTGAVKVTPAHDPNDYEMGLRHALPMVDVMNPDATINANGGRFEGLDRFEARSRVKEALDELGLLVNVTPHRHSVGHSSRSRAVVEPRLSEQWFVDVTPLAEPVIEAVRSGRTGFVPERNAKGFLDWMENLRDWCISRQLWWGHRIPAWYDEHGETHVLREDPDPALGWTQDPDVLDTWFSAWLWPFVTLGWPERTPSLQTWYPTTVLVTGYDINTFWVSRMLMAGLHFLDEVPFDVVLNHGLVRDRLGKKMSKSFGNVIDPLELIDRYGADALRFALLRAAAPGQDVPLAEEWVEGARRFANKLWNAGRLVLSKVGETTPADGLPAADELQPEDRWILSRLEAARAAAEDAYDGFDLARAARAIYHFVWDEYCDWYLELAKLRDDPAARRVLVGVLDEALRLLHPIMPFVTEEIWRTLTHAGDDGTIMRAAWPAAAPQRTDPRAEAELDALRAAVTELRRFRADHGLAPSARLEVIAVAAVQERAVLEAGIDGIRRLAGVGSWSFADAPPDRSALGKLVIGGAELYVPLAGLVDLDGERSRLARDLDRALAEKERAERKLSNPGFVAKAPAAVVQAERDKVAEWDRALRKLSDQLDGLG